MKKTCLSIMLLAVAATLFVSTRFADPAKPKERITIAYRNGVEDFGTTLQALNKASETFNADQKQLDTLRRLFIQCRYAYKKIECFSAYLDYYSTGMLNGPNLPKIEYEQNEPFSHNPPTGLQVLEEILYAEETPNKEDLVQAIQGFSIPMRTLRSQTLGLVFTDEMIFDAFRHQMLRILTLGITGFDNPVALNSLSEAKVSLLAIQEYYGEYQDEINELDEQQFREVNKLLILAQTYLGSHQDFNRFDRAHFTKTFLDPLFKGFQTSATLLKIKPIDQGRANQTPIFTQATSIFAKDLIKPYFFHPKQIDQPREGLVELGKLLFFDPILSSNNKRACASCHNPQKAFSDGNTSSLAFGFGNSLKRNAPTLLNAGLQQKFQLDARAFHMEDQFAHVMFSPDEMGSNATMIYDKLNRSKEYKNMFQKAFRLPESEEITHELAFAAIASYIRTLNTFNSPFDKYMRGELKKMDQEVVKGFNLFMGKAKCGTCHFAPVFNGTIPPDYTNTESEVLGVTLNNDFKHPKLDQDPGRYVVANIEEHKHSFKTPTLRNIALTAPYMHNGAYQTLEEVMEFYNQGGGAGLGLEVPYQTLPSDKLNLSKKEIKQVIKFMKALTDTTYTTSTPKKLPDFEEASWNARKIGGEY